MVRLMVSVGLAGLAGLSVAQLRYFAASELTLSQHWNDPDNWNVLVNGQWINQVPVNGQNTDIEFSNAVWGMRLGAVPGYSAVNGNFRRLDVAHGDFHLIGGTNVSLAFSNSVNILRGQTVSTGTRLTLDNLFVNTATTALDGRDIYGLAGPVSSELFLMNNASFSSGILYLREGGAINTENSRLSVAFLETDSFSSGAPGSLTGRNSTWDLLYVNLNGMGGTAVDLLGTQATGRSWHFETDQEAVIRIQGSSIDLASGLINGNYVDGDFLFRSTGTTRDLQVDLVGSTLSGRRLDLDGRVVLDISQWGTISLASAGPGDRSQLTASNGAQIVHGNGTITAQDLVLNNSVYQQLANGSQLTVDRIEASGAVLSLGGNSYVDREVNLREGARLILQSDGFLDVAGDGYTRVFRATENNQTTELIASGGSAFFGRTEVGAVEDYPAGPVRGRAALEVVGNGQGLFFSNLSLGARAGGFWSTNGSFNKFHQLYDGESGEVSFEDYEISNGVFEGSRGVVRGGSGAVGATLAVAANSTLRIASRSSLVVGLEAGASNGNYGWRPGYLVVTGRNAPGLDGFGWDGVLFGTGRVIGGVEIRDGLHANGWSPGRMTIEGDYELTGGTVEFEIGGPQAGIDYDQLVVLGNIRLESGTIRLRRYGNYLSSGFESFQLFSGFDSLSLGTGVTFDVGEGLVFGGFDPITGLATVQVVPEPVTIGGLGLGVASLLFRTRRRRRSA